MPSAPRIGSPWPSNWPISPEWDSQKAIEEGYKASYIYYSVSSDLADCQIIPSWGVYKDEKLVDDHPLMEMIRRPNNQQTWGSLLELWDLDKSLAGDAYGQWETIGDKVVVWRLRPDRVEIRPFKDGPYKGQIDKYLYSLSGDFLNPDAAYDPAQIMHFMFADPGNDYYGLSPLKVAARLVNTSNAGLEWHEHTIKVGAKPDMILSPKNHLEPKQHKTLLQLLKDQVQGPKNAHRPLIPSEPMEILFASMTPAELDFLCIFDNYEDAVCKVLHVDPDALGKTGATYENKERAIRDKWDGPVTSRARGTRAVMNLIFREDFGTADPKEAGPGDISINYDMDGTPGVQWRRNENREHAPKLWACGVPWNELNEKMDLGFEPIDGGDVGYVPVNVLPVGTPPAEGERSVRSIRDGVSDLHYRATDRKRQGWERGVAKKVSALFAAESSAVVKAVKSGKTNTDPAIESQRSNWVAMLTAVYRAVIEDFGEEVAEELTPRTIEKIEERINPWGEITPDKLSDVIGTRDFDPWSAEVKKYVTARVAEEVKFIQDTTKKVIKNVVQSGIDSGQSVVKIAKNIRETFDNWEEGTDVYRAMKIARTEVHAAAGTGMHESAKQSGVAKKKAWLDAGDDRVRVAHVNNTGQGWIPFDDAYQDGAMFPGDGTNDINCRCVEMYKSG